MPKKKTYDENMNDFINQMKFCGVTDKTIKKVLDEIQQYQEKLIEKQLKEMHNRWSEILREAMNKNENI